MAEEVRVRDMRERRQWRGTCNPPIDLCDKYSAIKWRLSGERKNQEGAEEDEVWEAMRAQAGSRQK